MSSLSTRTAFIALVPAVLVGDIEVRTVLRIYRVWEVCWQKVALVRLVVITPAGVVDCGGVAHDARVFGFGFVES